MVNRGLVGILDGLIGFSSAASRVGAWCAGTVFVVSAALVSIEVVVRKAFNWSITGIDELSGFALAMGIAWGLAFTLLHRAHIRIDTLLVILPAKARALLDIFGTLLFIGYMIVVTRQGFVVLNQSIAVDATGTTIAVPMMIPQAVWLAGLVFFVLVAVLLVLRSTLAMLSGDSATVQNLMGSRSVLGETGGEARPDTDHSSR